MTVQRSLLALMAVLALLGGCKTGGFTDVSSTSATSQPNRQSLDLATAQDLAVRNHLEMGISRYQETITKARVAALREDTLPSLLSQSAGYPTGQGVMITADGKSDSLPDTFATAWNSVDFGAAFVQTAFWRPERSQEAIRRRVANNLIMQTRALFWQARLADELLPTVNQLFNQVQGAVDQLTVGGSSNPAAMRELTETSSKILRAREVLMNSRRDLAQLTGYTPTTLPRLEGQRQEQLGVDLRIMSPVALERYVISHRPGMQEADAKEGISLGRTRLSLIRLLPGLERRFHPRNEPGDRAMRPINWDRAGLMLAKRLMTWFGASSADRTAKNNPGEMAGTRRLAFQMASVLQAHLSLASMQFSLESYQRADIEERGGTGADPRPESFARDRNDHESFASDSLKARVDRLLSTIRRGMAYSRYQVAVARFQTTLGMDLRSESSLNWNMAPLVRQVVAWREPAPGETVKEESSKADDFPPLPPPPPQESKAPPPAAPPPAPAPPPQPALPTGTPAGYQPLEHSMMGQQPPPATMNFQGGAPTPGGNSYYLAPGGNLVPQTPQPPPQAIPPQQAMPPQQVVPPMPQQAWPPAQPAPMMPPQPMASPYAQQPPPQQAAEPPLPPPPKPPATLDFTGGGSSGAMPATASPARTKPVLDFTGDR
ncbi:MAG: TolC family protein [Magnetococcales bacterium]|nr:TolC family protein [Magnetococcales bacterium]